MEELAFEVSTSDPFEETKAAVIAALKAEGFGVLTEIDVRKTLKEKLDEDFRPYVILGACNPSLAHRALKDQPKVGVLLPCNVTVERIEAGSLVRIANPEVMLAAALLDGEQELRAVAGEARERLQRVAQRLAAG